MKAGEVVYIRLSPEDVMTCIDIVKGAGINTLGMSLGQCIKLAVHSMCEGARAIGAAPRREGFDYTVMLQEFKGFKQEKKLAFTRKLEQVGLAAREAGVADVKPAFQPTQAQQQHMIVLKERKKRRMQELSFKKKADPLNFSAQEAEELERLASELIIGYS